MVDYSFLDREEYKDIPIFRIVDNQNGLPFFIARLNKCAFRKHRHEYVQIIYICNGRLKHVINDNSFDVFKGDIFIIPPFVPHYFIDGYCEAYELIELEFIPEFINEKFSLVDKTDSFIDFAYLEPFLVSENEIKPRLNLQGSSRYQAEDIFNEILKEYSSRDDDFVLVIKALLLKLLVMVGREYKKSASNTETGLLLERHRDALRAAIKYINDNIAADISLEDAARVAMLSQSYFRYLFKQLTQKTFTEYINSIRIAKAVELLKTKPDMKIVDISCEVGFNNVNHFNRIFRQETGMTPLAVRKG